MTARVPKIATFAEYWLVLDRFEPALNFIIMTSTSNYFTGEMKSGERKRRKELYFPDD